MSPSARDHELFTELLHRVGGLLREVVPPEAQVHLLNAQRELLTALMIMYEHQAAPRRPGRPAATRRPSATRRRAPAGGLRHIEIK